MKIEVHGEKFLVDNRPFFCKTMDSLQEATEALRLEMWFEKELKALNRPLSLTDAMALRQEWGLSVPAEYRDSYMYIPGEF